MSLDGVTYVGQIRGFFILTDLNSNPCKPSSYDVEVIQPRLVHEKILNITLTKKIFDKSGIINN